MPTDFPNMDSLIRAAKVHKFRQPSEGEAEIDYRTALANHVSSRDFIESEEIRNGRGWDRWDDGQKKALLGRRLLGT
jgi:hypothetical protein